MIPGFRYHVATIAAIFLALGIGIAMGSSFVQTAIVERQSRQLEDLKAQFAREVVATREENRRYRGFVATLTPGLLSGRLANLRIAIVQTGDYPDAARALRGTLEQAGASVTSVTALDRTFLARCEVSLNEILPRLRATHPGLAGSVGSVLRVLAVAVARGAPTADMEALDQGGLIEREGDYTRGNDAVVLVGGASEGFESRVERLDAPFIMELKALGVTVVAAEPEEAGVSYVPALRSLNIATVDNVDTDIGRIALVLAVRAGRGDYGVKQTAQSGILPPIGTIDGHGDRTGP